MLFTALFFLSTLPAQQPEYGGGWDTHLLVQGTVKKGFLGSQGCSPGDLDADGTPDWLVTGGNAIRSYSGSDGSLLHAFGTQGDARFAGAGDVNQDGHDDYLVGQATYSRRGKVFLFDGATGSPIVGLEGEQPDAGFGARVDSIADLDADGIRDWVIAAPYYDGPHGSKAGRLSIYSGKYRTLLGVIDGQGDGHALGKIFDVIGDVDGDGFEDLLAGIPNTWADPDYGRAMVYSGATGALLLTLVSPHPGDAMGEDVTSPGDVSGDGVPDLLVTAPLSVRNGFPKKLGFVFSGADGALIHEMNGAHFGREPHGDAGGVGDLDEDGVPDFFASYAPFPGADGSVGFHSGATGELIHLLEGVPDSRFGASVAVTAEPDANGYRRVMIGAPRRTPLGGPRLAGELRVMTFEHFLSADANELSVSAGGAIDYQLDFPGRAAGQRYRLLASASGKGPTEVGDLVIPLTYDGLLERTRDGVYPGASAGNHSGILDADGRAVATLGIAPGAWSSLAGTTLHVAAVAGPVGQGFELVSRAVRLDLVP